MSVRTIPQCLTTPWRYLSKNVLSSLVCVRVCTLCVHRGLSLAHHQRGTDFVLCDICLRMTLTIPAVHLCPRPKNVLGSWSLVVICALITTGLDMITAWYDSRFEVPGTRHYIREYSSIYVRKIGYVQVPEHHLFATYWYHVSLWIYIDRDVPRTRDNIYVLIMYLALMLYMHNLFLFVYTLFMKVINIYTFKLHLPPPYHMNRWMLHRRKNTKMML